MITNISIVSVFVKDVDESKRFYIDVLGFEEKDDITLGDGYRWCTVVHPNQPELQVSLAIPGPPFPDDSSPRCSGPRTTAACTVSGLNVDDCQKTYERADRQGRRVPPAAVRAAPYGTEAVCRDNSGNWLVLVQEADRKVMAADFA